MGSPFARIFAGHTGVDPYTTAVSDLYQDLFDEGIFTGKGLYDVDAFMAALENRVPENAVLSHDLFEGLYATSRAGRPTSRSWTTIPPACWRTPAGSTGGREATGSCCRGCCPCVPDTNGPDAQRRCRSSRAGRSSTT